MHRLLWNVVLLGAAIMAITPLLTAQNASAPPTHAPKYRFEVSAAYDAVLTNLVTNSRFSMQGGSAQVQGRLYRDLSVVADIAGENTANINSTGVGLDLVTATFGPRCTWHSAHSRYALFGQALAGEAHGFNGLFPTVNGAKSTANSLALKMGGGADISLSPRVGIRAFEADWLRTQLPNSTTNAQNNLCVGAGVFFRF